MKKIASFSSAILLFIIFCFTSTAEAVKFTPPFELNSESVYLMNLDENSVIYEKNADIQQMPAALANIMTAIIVLENCSNPDEVTITADDTLYWEFGTYEYPYDLRYGEIYDGDTLTVSDYLYAMMLTSSCEAANILADYFGNHDISSFVDKMNKKTTEIGAEHTVFANPHGLYDSSQVTTARDMAVITQYALTVSGFEEIATTEDYEVHPKSCTEDHGEIWTWSHSNIAMSSASSYYLFGIKGIKTGNLELGGRNLITIGEYNGCRYLLVLMNAPLYDEEGDSKYYHIIDEYNIMQWVFDNFEYKELLYTDEEIAEIKVKNSDGDGYVLVEPESSVSELWYNDIDITVVQRNYKLYENVEAPIKKGQKLGELELKFSGETIASVNLVAAADVERSLVKFNFSAAKSFLGSIWFKRAFVISSALILIYLALCIFAFIYMKKNPKNSFANKKVVNKIYRNKRK